MKSSGLTRTITLLLLLGSVVLSCAAQDRPSESKDHPKQDTARQQAKPAEQHEQQPRSSAREEQPVRQQQRQPAQSQRQPAQSQPARLTAAGSTTGSAGAAANGQQGARTHQARAGSRTRAAEPGATTRSASRLATASGRELAVGPPHLAATRRIQRLPHSWRPLSRLLWSGTWISNPGPAVHGGWRISALPV
jgi:hypothetical protein